MRNRETIQRKKMMKKNAIMRKNEKIMITILIVITIIASIALVIKNNKKKLAKETSVQETVGKYVEILDDGTKLNRSIKLQETKKIDDMEISDIQITEKDNVTLLLGVITNKSNEVKGDYPIDIKVLDDQGNEIITVGGYIGELEPGESTQLNCSATFDYANAYDFEIIKNQ